MRLLKRALVPVLFLSMLCSSGFTDSVYSFLVPTPQDDWLVRGLLANRKEFKPLMGQWLTIFQKQLLPLQAAQVTEIFGAPLSSNTNWWSTSSTADGGAGASGPQLQRMPIKQLVLPCFASTTMGVSGLHSLNPAENKNHTDLHSVGDIGYLEFFYQNDGNKIQTAALFFRADDKFVPLRTPPTTCPSASNGTRPNSTTSRNGSTPMSPRNEAGLHGATPPWSRVSRLR